MRIRSGFFWPAKSLIVPQAIGCTCPSRGSQSSASARGGPVFPVPVEQGSEYTDYTKSGSLKEFVGEKQPAAHTLFFPVRPAVTARS